MKGERNKKRGGKFEKTVLKNRLKGRLRFFFFGFLFWVTSSGSLQRQRESDAALAALEREIRSINALTRIVPAVKCRVDLQQVLHRGTLDPRVGF